MGGYRSGKVGCIGIGLAVLAVCWVIALFLTPIPYVVIGIAAAWFSVVALHRQRTRKRYFDAIASLHGLSAAPAEALERLWQDGEREPDVQLLRAAYLAAYGAHDQATQVLSAISNDTKRFGRISGQVSLVFPGLAEPLWFGSGAHVQPNLALVRAYERGLLGDYRAAEELARPQAGRQPIATASALGRVYAAQGRHDLAANAVGSVASMAPGAAASLLYYQWATHLADSGALAQARDVFGRLGEFGDSRARATVLEGQLDEARERQAVERQNAAERAREAKRRRVDQEDQLVLAEALDRVELARGPRSRDQALDWGLERIRQEHVRHQLRLEASRLEVRAVLDKVEGLKTPAAKRRNIEEALDRLRADRVRDELQATEIALLEAALRDLEGGR